jgi:hypothetical protein
MFHEVVRFPYQIIKISQVVIIERSLDDLLTKAITAIRKGKIWKGNIKCHHV